MIRQLQYFKKVFVPKTIEPRIQECAINHLKVRDIGKLRDKYEGQRYYDILRLDIISEYVFEKHLSLGDFDWESRLSKNYKRKSYQFEGQEINLVNFSIGTFPKFDPDSISNVVFVYIKPELKCYISGFASKKLISEVSQKPLEYNPLNPELKEIRDFKDLVRFENKDDLKIIINSF